MRQLPKKTLFLGKRKIGAELPLICIPLVEKEPLCLNNAAQKLLELAPDLIEWRVDAFAGIADIDLCLQALADLRKILGEIPLLFTCRRWQEGGFLDKNISQDKRLALYDKAMASGYVDLVDVELENGRAFLQAVRDKAQRHGVYTVFSSHNFLKTPEEKEMLALLVEAEEQGADIAKLAVMANCYRDVLRLFSATCIARTDMLSIPMITVAMGEEGKISRLAGGFFGSDITFASGDQVSAPGQLPIGKTRQALALLY